MLKRIIAAMISGVLLAGGLIAPALAGGQGSASPARGLPKLRVFNNPVPQYLTKSCAINFASIPDFTDVTSVTGCGMRVRFSVPMEKRTVGVSWNTWASPPFTETATPRVLWTQAETAVTLTFSVRSRIVGVEVEPNTGNRTFDATFRRLSGASLGTISRDAAFPSGARLLAGKVKSDKKAARVKTLTIETDESFAIARIRVIRP